VHSLESLKMVLFLQWVLVQASREGKRGNSGNWIGGGDKPGWSNQLARLRKGGRVREASPTVKKIRSASENCTKPEGSSRDGEEFRKSGSAGRSGPSTRSSEIHENKKKKGRGGQC